MTHIIVQIDVAIGFQYLSQFVFYRKRCIAESSEETITYPYVN